MNAHSSHGTNILAGEKPFPATSARRENPWAWALFALLLVVYAFSALRTNPVASFGSAADDALYFSSAKALASGHGYILPSFPVPLRATRYPELYPLLLAGVWKLDPRFPGNITIAAALTLAFGCLALLFSFLLLRRWPSLGDWQALAIVALCAFIGYFLTLSASILSDVPFMAMMLGAIWLTQVSSNRAKPGAAAALGAGVLAGLSIGFRTVGISVVAGIGLFFLLKRDLRRFAWFTLAALPLTALWLLPMLASLLHPPSAALAVGPDASGWAHTLCYYTSYACEWRMGVDSPSTFRAIVLGNLQAALQVPGFYLLSPLCARFSLANLILVTVMGVACYVGLTRSARRHGLEPLSLVFGFYLLLIVPWPYPLGRFLLIFFPLLLGGLWLETRRLAALIARHLASSHPFGDRIVAGLFAAAGLGLALLVAVNYAYEMPAQTAGTALSQSRLLSDERGAYTWINRHAVPAEPIVAYQDGLLFLYTGHPAIVPVQVPPQWVYVNDPGYATRAAAHVSDIARHVRAAYWLVSTEDFRLFGDLRPVLQRAQLRFLASAPLVYRSPDDAVRLYDVRCLTAVSSNACAPQRPPSGQP